MAPNLKVFYQNVRGLRTKCLEFRNNLLNSDHDIVVVTETWLHDGIFDEELGDCRYDVFRSDRDLKASNRRSGGGVMILTRRELDAVRCDHSPPPPAEMLTITVPARALAASLALHITVAYVPPDTQISSNIDSILNTFSFIFDRHPLHNYLILGDFNSPNISWSLNGPIYQRRGTTEIQEAGIRLINDLLLLGISQYNILKNHAGNTLDLAFSNLPLLLQKSSQPLVKVDRPHPPIIMEILDLAVKPLCEISPSRPNFKKGDYESLNAHFDNMEWGNLTTVETVDDACEHFYQVINDAIEKHVPLTRVANPKRVYPIWYSKALINIIKEKTKCHLRWKKYNNRLDYDEFALLRARQKRVQNACFKSYVANMETSISHAPKKFWSYVKSLRGGSTLPRSVTLGNVPHTDSKSICKAFSNFFSSVFGAPNTLSSYNTSYESIDFISKLSVPKEVIVKLLKGLDVTKGSGSDGIPPFFWKGCADTLAYPIALIFNRSLREGTFPAVWKEALIIPIHKKGSKTKVENYRGISILNTLGKAFEKIVYGAIYPVLVKGMSENQHGFLQKRSTITNLSSFTDYVLKSMDGGGQVDVIYTDYEKAFDRVDHCILINKLQVLGIHGDLLRWIQSYLANRSQAVVVGGHRSDYIKVPSGVPQGSHLGPLLFNAYLFDISQCFKHARYLMYADDKKIFLKINNIGDCDALQHDLNNLTIYYRNNNINLNISKCQSISFTRKRKPITYTYSFYDVPIPKIDVIRDLGVILDSKFTMSNHIDGIVSKAFKNLGFVLRTCKPFNNISSLMSVYFAYVRSILEYASPIWSPQYKTYTNRLEHIQKKFVDHLNYRSRTSHRSYLDSCRHHGLLTLQERRDMLDMSLLYDVLNGHIDSTGLVASVAYCAPRRRTRHTLLLHIPGQSCKYSSNSVLSRIARTYNDKYKSIDVFAHSKNKFKHKLFLQIKEGLD